MKKAVSVTLGRTNLLWLQGRVAAGAARSVSELLDDLVADARASGRGVEAGMRSVVGSIDIDASDPELLTADAAIRTQFDRSVRRPMVVRERPPKPRGRE
jgi:hypothetical protein